MKGYRKQLGQWGEDLAKKFYERLGYRMIENNWRIKCGEIDIIFEKNKEIVFVEVKTRTTKFFGYGEEAVNYGKKIKIKKTINYYLLNNPQYGDYFPRFDILVVELDELTPNYVSYENVPL